MTILEKLTALRKAMKTQGLAAYIVPSSDPHQSEYVAAHWKSRQWVSGFSGSSGTVVVTADHAGVWTDSRYFIQAEEQLKGSPVELHKLLIPHTPEHLDWLKENLPAGSKIGLDGRLFSVGQVRRIAKAFYDKNFELVTGVDLFAESWEGRPDLPQSAVFQHDIKFAGVAREQKLQAVRDKMGGADYYFVSTLDDIAWLLNLRGSDVECNPVFYAFAIIGKEAAWLFIEPEKVPEDIKWALNLAGVLVKPYDEIEPFLKNIAEGKSILVDLNSINNQLYNALEKDRIVEGDNIVMQLKALKNPVEIQHIRHAMTKDGAALVRLFRWLDGELLQRAVPETEVAEKLDGFRRAQGDYFGESFSAIVGYKGNGAIIHYRPEHGLCANIEKDGILLLDSGGQYFDGTTDITRTVALSTPTTEQKRDFTLVLKGMIGLTLAVFPKGTTGVQLDTFARMYLWQHFKNYGHGTGHGVGFFNNVHEPPQGFSPVPHTPRANITIEPGTLTSNEPGLYLEGQYGIRCENLVLCKEVGESSFGKFYGFETVTLFPFDLNLLEVTMLTKEEKDWLNDYHSTVYERVSPLLEEEERAWLKEKCGRV